MDFQKILFKWYDQNKRDLPWRNTVNPYFIWMSEIILQQTRVDQGLPYYIKFIKYFPVIQDLASAKEDDVLKLWQGLGYYSRARNLHNTAKYIVENFDGKFPKNYDEILSLKGIGPYTAAAIVSFSFNMPYAVVDGNVIRVLSRIFGVEIPFDSTEGKKFFQDLATKLLDHINPSIYNQAIMEFGALYCKAKNPLCGKCPFIKDCIAFNTNNVNILPVKLNKTKIKKRYLHFFMFHQNSYTYIVKRKDGIWKGLYEFPFIEFNKRRSNLHVKNSVAFKAMFSGEKYCIQFISNVILHKLSHQHIYAKIWHIKSSNVKLKNFNRILIKNLNSYPISRLMEKFLEPVKMT